MEFEMEDIFDRVEARARRERLAAALEQNAIRAEQEAAQEAKRRAEATAYTIQVNERQRLAEYRLSGVQPPVVDGVPVRTSLALLLSIGWMIERDADRNVLMPPPNSAGHGSGRRRDDHNT